MDALVCALRATVQLAKQLPLRKAKGMVTIMTKKDLEQYFVPSLTLLETDLTETELLFRKMVFTEHAFPSRKRLPTSRTEASGYVFFRWNYELPERPFTGLKKLILELRRRTGLKSSYRGIIGIDVTPWKGHETEEYFQIMQKYLYDNSEEWNLVYICSGYSPGELSRLQYICANYFILHSQQAYIYSHEAMNRYIQNAFSEFNVTADRKAVQDLAAALVDRLPKENRTLQVIHRIAYEILRRETEQKEKVLRISEGSIGQYLQEPESSLAILTKICMETRCQAYEKAI